MIESSLTLYKLIILYMLQKVNFPLTNAQISDCILEEGYTNYFHLQQALSEMEESRLLQVEKVRNTTFYHMTEEGSRTLEFFGNEISPEIQADVDRYLKAHAFEMRNKASTVADYYQTSGREFAVRCQVLEKKLVIFEMTVTVPTEEMAQNICRNWERKSQKIYAAVMKELA